MNEQNAFYQANRGRASGYGTQQQSKFLELSVWPRLIIETIIKRDMGVRYFPFLSVLIVTAFLFFVPYLISMFNNFRIGINSADSTWEIITGNKSWYIFLIILIFSAFKRRQEIIAYSLKGKEQRYSLSNGRPMRFFYLIETKKRPVTLREIETIYEPLFVILIGFILLLTGNFVGLLLIICGFGYKINYNIMYGINDNYLMEKEDQMIFNEAMVNTLVNKQEKEQAQNGRRPADADFKRSATNHQENDEDIRAK